MLAWLLMIAALIAPNPDYHVTPTTTQCVQTVLPSGDYLVTVALPPETHEDEVGEILAFEAFANHVRIVFVSQDPDEQCQTVALPELMPVRPSE
jgi:hypothetical protein